MNLRLAVYQLAAANRLGSDATARLLSLAGLDTEPQSLVARFWRTVAVLGAALGGLGIVMWLAANWDTLGRGGRFALLQGLVAVMLLGAAWRRPLRAPLGLLALLGIGGLFAYFGQTYQTGADPWQLFALWAVLALPLCLAVRSDVLWTPWAVVVMTGISLWTQAHTGHSWRVHPEDLPSHLIGFGASALLVLLMSTVARRWTGAGPWALRTASTLFVIAVTLTALGGLFSTPIAPHYTLGLVLLVAAAAWLSTRRGFEIFALSAVALGLNALVLCGLARVLFDTNKGDAIGSLLVMGLVSAGLLAASVHGILRLSRYYVDKAEGVQ
jgi:uncharacterized membrane protein